MVSDFARVLNVGVLDELDDVAVQKLHLGEEVVLEVIRALLYVVADII